MADENDANDIVIDDAAVSPKVDEAVVSDAGENAVTVMTRHFRDHPENRASDVASIMSVLVPWVEGSEERRDVFQRAAVAADHPLKDELEAVFETL